MDLGVATQLLDTKLRSRTCVDIATFVSYPPYLQFLVVVSFVPCTIVRVAFNETVMALIWQPGAHHLCEALCGFRCVLRCVLVNGQVNDWNRTWRRFPKTGKV